MKHARATEFDYMDLLPMLYYVVTNTCMYVASLHERQNNLVEKCILTVSFSSVKVYFTLKTS